jgi:hypothetical protein
VGEEMNLLTFRRKLSVFRERKMEIKSHTMNASESVVYIVIRDRDKLDYG